MRASLQTLLIASVGLSLGGCSGGGTSAGGTMVVEADPVETATADVPTPEATPDATSRGDGDQSALATAKFNYTYPDQAAISVKAVSYDAAAKQVHVQVALDHSTPNTVTAHIVTSNGTLNTQYYTPTDTWLTFYPGDPLVKTVTVPIVKFKAGGTFYVKIPDTPQGAKKGTVSATITATAGAPATVAIVGGGRAPRTYAPTGTLKYDMNISTVKWSPTGGPGVWSTSLTASRAQPSNGETGLYLDDTIWSAPEKPLKIVGGQLVLHTQKLAKPITYAGGNWGWGAGTYNYGAAVLSGLKTPETQVTYGSYEWTAMMPTRTGAWPCLWLVGVNGWPPEIDVYEGMSHIQNWDMQRTAWNAIHGGPVNNQTFAPGSQLPTKLFGVENLSNSFHKYSVTIDSQYITYFLDGKETWQVVNMFVGQGAFFPLMSVGVKTTGAFTEGSPDMTISSFKVYENKAVN